MEQEIIVATIAMICQFSDPTISKQNKEICMEKVVNCAIIKGGQTSEKLLQECGENVKSLKR